MQRIRIYFRISYPLDLRASKIGVTTPSAVPIIDPSPSKMTIKKKMTDKIYDPGKSETASATAIKISPVPDGASLVSV